MQNKKNSQGFTIVELLIVVAIIGILAAVAVPAYFNHVLRTRQAEAYHNLLDIKAAQEMFLSMENYYYPTAPPVTLLTGNSLTDLLSFSYADTKYYRYRITSASGTAFTAKAEGKYGKLAGEVFRIEDDQDPCIESPGNVKLSLGLEPCP